ncbi:MAG: SRPBCC family protein [Arenibacterium sp.]
MKQVQSTVEIDASPQRVWDVLTDAKTLSESNLGITKLDGEISDGSSFKLWADISPNRAFALTVTQFRPGEFMEWTGGMPLGLFTGKRQFRLSANGNGTVLDMEETFTGLLSGVIWKSMPDLQPSFDQFAQGVKRLAEQG